MSGRRNEIRPGPRSSDPRRPTAGPRPAAPPAPAAAPAPAPTPPRPAWGLPWLGQQEGLYSGLRWHLKVPQHTYTEQFNPPNAVVFPGEARVNVTGATPQATVDLEGHVGTWTTDVQMAVGKAPKLYGFDFARATEVWDDANNLNKIMPQLQPVKRADIGEFVPGERAVMKDLILSTLYMGGEVCLSHHMFNPYSIQPMTDVPGNAIGDYFSFGNGAGFSDGLKSTDLAGATTTAAYDYVRTRLRYLSAFLEEVLSSSQISPQSNIYVRLFHEPNAKFFWWGQEASVSASDQTFMDNYHKLWNFAVAEVRGNITSAAVRNRVKFVFSINGEHDAAALRATLDEYLPSNPNLFAQTFINNLDVIGLDYYQDSSRGGVDTLDGQYAEVVARANNLGKDHALTEVGITTDYAGKLYGEHANLNPWQPASTRKFFGSSVKPVATTHRPKWVMFWANRLGNSVLANYEPTTTNSGTPNHSGLYYGDADPSGTCVDVLTHPAGEIFTPATPQTSFSMQTYDAGELTLPKRSFTVGGGDSELKYLPGAVVRCGCAVTLPVTRTAGGEAMKDAVDDFNAMMAGPTFETL